MKAEHLEVYRQPGRFAGWPANYGIWSWGKEIVVSFTLGHMDLSGGFTHVTNRDPLRQNRRGVWTSGRPGMSAKLQHRGVGTAW